MNIQPCLLSAAVVLSNIIASAVFTNRINSRSDQDIFQNPAPSCWRTNSISDGKAASCERKELPHRFLHSRWLESRCAGSGFPIIAKITIPKLLTKLRGGNGRDQHLNYQVICKRSSFSEFLQHSDCSRHLLWRVSCVHAPIPPSALAPANIYLIQ
jgi:hypothetical protein